MKALRAAAVATGFVTVAAAIVIGLLNILLFFPHPWGLVAVLGLVVVVVWAAIFAMELGSHP